VSAQQFNNGPTSAACAIAHHSEHAALNIE
jgi:hypothetical protein